MPKRANKTRLFFIFKKRVLYTLAKPWHYLTLLYKNNLWMKCSSCPSFISHTVNHSPPEVNAEQRSRMCDVKIKFLKQMKSSFLLKCSLRIDTSARILLKKCIYSVSFVKYGSDAHHCPKKKWQHLGINCFFSFHRRELDQNKFGDLKLQWTSP